MFATRVPLRDGDPERIGDIQIQSRLGAGGMGVVYEGRTKEGRPVAVKVLRNGDWSTPESRAALTREARAIGSIKSRHVAELLATDVEGEYPYLVLELVEGQPLNKAVPHGGFDTETATIIAQQILEGLNAAHNAGVFHQDLKPSNVVLSDAGVKLIDFGVAAIADPGTQTSLTLGTSGEGSGTMAWLAPEQIRGAPGSEKSDVFAWGMVADYAATGRNPFGSGRPEAVMYAIVNDEPDLGRVDRQLGDAILAALNKDPNTRPTTKQIQAMIGTAASTSSPLHPLPGPQAPATGTEEGTDRSSKLTQRTSGRHIALAVGALLVVLVAGLLLGRTTAPTPSADISPDTSTTSAIPSNELQDGVLPLGSTVLLGDMELTVHGVDYEPMPSNDNLQQAVVNMTYKNVGGVKDGYCWGDYARDDQGKEYEYFDEEESYARNQETVAAYDAFKIPADRQLATMEIYCESSTPPRQPSILAQLK